MSISLQADITLPQGYLKVNGTTAATITSSGIVGNVTGNLAGNVTGNVTGNADTATAATTATKLATTGGSAPVYGCRAWVNFDGTKDTTGAASTANTNRLIRASGNVTSVLRTASGIYTVNFTTPMADANYSAVASTQLSGQFNVAAQPYTYTQGAINIYTANSAGPVDPSFISVAIFA